MSSAKLTPIQKFNHDYMNVKTALFLMLTNEQPTVEATITGIRADEFDAVIGSCMEYLLGKDINQPPPTTSPKVRAIIKRMAPKIPGIAKQLYNMGNLDAVISAILDYKDANLTELLGDDWAKTDEAKRVRKLIKATPASIEDTEDYQETWEWLNSL